MGYGDFFYYTLLKNAKIVIVVLLTIVAILVFMYMKKFGVAFSTTTDSSLRYCESDVECVEHCGECVSIVTSQMCDENSTIECVCIDNLCQIA